MSSAEMRLREVEALLDQRLSELRLGATFDGLAVRDLSARNYRYKNHMLSWSWQFVRDHPIDGEIERISVLLTYLEPLLESDALTIFVRSEVFQHGQISKIDRKHEYRVPIEQITATGLEPILGNAFDHGRKLRRDSEHPWNVG